MELEWLRLHRARSLSCLRCMPKVITVLNDVGCGAVGACATTYEHDHDHDHKDRKHAFFVAEAENLTGMGGFDSGGGFQGFTIGLFAKQKHRMEIGR